MRNLVKIWSSLILILLLSACRSTKDVSPDGGQSNDKDHTVTVVHDPNSLADFLSRVPGVFVDDRGGRTQVTIRGGQPLFVVDGVRIGHSYASAQSAVNVYDIQSVEVLKSPSETLMYGRDGAHGVIIIKTKGS